MFKFKLRFRFKFKFRLDLGSDSESRTNSYSNFIIIKCLLWTSPILIFPLCFLLHDEAINCPYGWTAFRNKCFRYYFDAPKTWAIAELYCQNLGGNLATINDEAEDQVVLTLTDGGSDRWIGLHDQHQEGLFTWADGSSVSYEQWLPGQPDNRDDVEDCVEYSYNNNGWNDDV